MMQTIIGETHHIGYLVKNIDKTLSLYQQLGFELVTEKNMMKFENLIYVF